MQTVHLITAYVSEDWERASTGDKPMVPEGTEQASEEGKWGPVWVLCSNDFTIDQKPQSGLMIKSESKSIPSYIIPNIYICKENK